MSRLRLLAPNWLWEKETEHVRRSSLFHEPDSREMNSNHMRDFTVCRRRAWRHVHGGQLIFSVSLSCRRIDKKGLKRLLVAKAITFNSHGYEKSIANSYCKWLGRPLRNTDNVIVLYKAIACTEKQDLHIALHCLNPSQRHGSGKLRRKGAINMKNRFALKCSRLHIAIFLPA